MSVVTQGQEASSITPTKQENEKTKLSPPPIVTFVLRPIVAFFSPYTRVVFNPAFVILWVSALVSGMGNYFSEVAAIYIVEEGVSSSPNAGVLLSLLYICCYLPAIILMPLTGLASDKLDKRAIMVICDLGRLVMSGCCMLALIDVKQFYWVIYVSAGVSWTMAAFYDPAKDSLFPLIIAPENLLTSNALMAVTGVICASVGSTVGGYAMAWSPFSNFVFDIGTFVIASLLALSLCCFRHLSPKAIKALTEGETPAKATAAPAPIPEMKNPLDEEEIDTEILQTPATPTGEAAGADDVFATTPTAELNEAAPAPIRPAAAGTTQTATPKAKRNICASISSVIRESVFSLLDGVRYILCHPYILSATTLKGFAALNYAALEIVMVKFSNVFPVNGSAPTSFGIIKACAGVATGLAPLLADRFLPKNQRTMRGIIVFGFTMLVFGHALNFLSLHIAMLGAGCFLSGGGFGLVFTYSSGLLQTNTEVAYMGRVLAIDIAFWSFMQTLSSLGAGVLFDQFGFNERMLSLTQLIVAGAAFFLIAFWFLFTLARKEPTTTIVSEEGELVEAKEVPVVPILSRPSIAVFHANSQARNLTLSKREGSAILSPRGAGTARDTSRDSVTSVALTEMLQKGESFLRSFIGTGGFSPLSGGPSSSIFDSAESAKKNRGHKRMGSLPAAPSNHLDLSKLNKAGSLSNDKFSKIAKLKNLGGHEKKVIIEEDQELELTPILTHRADISNEQEEHDSTIVMISVTSPETETSEEMVSPPPREEEVRFISEAVEQIPPMTLSSGTTTEPTTPTSLEAPVDARIRRLASMARRRAASAPFDRAVLDLALQNRQSVSLQVRAARRGSTGGIPNIIATRANVQQQQTPVSPIILAPPPVPQQSPPRKVLIKKEKRVTSWRHNKAATIRHDNSSKRRVTFKY